MLVFLIASFIAVPLLTKITIYQMQKIGLGITGVSGVLLLLITLIQPQRPVLITLAMMLFSAGSALSLGSFITQALNSVPQFRGTSSALLGTIRLTLSSVAIMLAGYLFNGTIAPLALIIIALTLLSIILYYLV